MDSLRITIPPGRVLIRRPELRRRVPLSDTRIWELEQAGDFPKRIQLSPRCVAWDAAEVDAWIAARAAGRVAAAAVPVPRKGRRALPANSEPVSA